MSILFAMIPAIFAINPLIFLNRDHLDDYPGIHPFIIHQRAAFHISEINMYAYCLLPKPSTICHMPFCLFGNYSYRDLMLKCKKKTNNANSKPVPSRGEWEWLLGTDNSIPEVQEREGNGKNPFPNLGKGGEWEKKSQVGNGTEIKICSYNSGTGME